MVKNGNKLILCWAKTSKKLFLVCLVFWIHGVSFSYTNAPQDGEMHNCVKQEGKDGINK